MRLLRAGVAGVVFFVALGATPAGADPRVDAYLRSLYAVSVDRVDEFAAVDQAFARFGPVVLSCAHAIAERESHHSRGSNNGSHFGMFQLHAGFAGSIQAAATTLGRAPDFFDPYVNALAAAIGFEVAGGSFRRNWYPTVSRGCP